MFKSLLIIFLLALSLGAYASNKDDDATAARLFKAQQGLAEQGNAQAQYYLGEMYELGLGTPENINQAVVWYRKAAAQNHRMAQRKLSELAKDAEQAAIVKTKVEAPAPVLKAQPQPEPVVAAPVTKPVAKSPAKPKDDGKLAKAEAAREAAKAEADAKQAEVAAARAKAKKEAAEKEKRKAMAKAALERMKADAKKNGIGY